MCNTPRITEHGFTVTELLIVAAIIVVFGAISVALVAPAVRTSNLGQAFDTLVADVETRQRRAATTGRTVVYVPETELLRDDAVLVNDPRIPSPPGYTIASELRLEAATGKPLGPDAAPLPSAIIISGSDDAGEPADVTALCINRSGIVTTLRYLNHTWSPS